MNILWKMFRFVVPGSDFVHGVGVCVGVTCIYGRPRVLPHLRSSHMLATKAVEVASITTKEVFFASQRSQTSALCSVFFVSLLSKPTVGQANQRWGLSLTD